MFTGYDTIFAPMFDNDLNNALTFPCFKGIQYRALRIFVGSLILPLFLLVTPVNEGISGMRVIQKMGGLVTWLKKEEKIRARWRSSKKFN